MIGDYQFYIRRTFEIARRSREMGDEPFGSLLVDADGNVILEAENTILTDRDCTGHAETNLIRLACRRYDESFLSRCTLFSSTEPCAMCSGAIYWSGVGRVVFGFSATALHLLIGDNLENPTLKLPCREVFSRGIRPVEVIGPLLEEEGRLVHEGYWVR